MIVYVTTAPAVPLNDIVVVEPEQIEVVPDIVAVGKPTTTTVALAVKLAVAGGVTVVALINVYVVSAVNATVVKVAFPEASKVTVKLLTPSVNNTSAPGVPVKVNVPVCPEQIVLAEMVDVGDGGEQSIITQSKLVIAGQDNVKSSTLTQIVVTGFVAINAGEI